MLSAAPTSSCWLSACASSSWDSSSWLVLPSTTNHFNPEVFAGIHIKVAPVVCFIGYISMIAGVIYHKKDDTENADSKEAVK